MYNINFVPKRLEKSILKKHSKKTLFEFIPFDNTKRVPFLPQRPPTNQNQVFNPPVQNDVRVVDAQNMHQQIQRTDERSLFDYNVVCDNCGGDSFYTTLIRRELCVHGIYDFNLGSISPDSITDILENIHHDDEDTDEMNLSLSTIINHINDINISCDTDDYIDSDILDGSVTEIICNNCGESYDYPSSWQYY